MLTAVMMATVANTVVMEDTVGTEAALVTNILPAAAGLSPNQRLERA